MQYVNRRQSLTKFCSCHCVQRSCAPFSHPWCETAVLQISARDTQQINWIELHYLDRTVSSTSRQTLQISPSEAPSISYMHFQTLRAYVHLVRLERYYELQISRVLVTNHQLNSTCRTPVFTHNYKDTFRNVTPLLLSSAVKISWWYCHLYVCDSRRGLD